MYIVLDSMYVTMSISTGLYPNLDLWTANKLQLQLQLQSTLRLKSKSHDYQLPMTALISDFQMISAIKIGKSQNNTSSSSGIYSMTG
jgi:hypothetical protein